LMNCEDVCHRMGFNVTGETRHLFSLLESPPKSGFVDIRTLLTAMCNFLSDVTLDDRCKVTFDLYDEDKSGFLTLNEIEDVLMGTSLQIGNRPAVQKRAATIMKFTDTDKSGYVCYNELREAATKFPNLLFPSNKTSKKP
jgi:Ca2+-binding EF-hand superfamily protein